jgi:hypothetical protein
VQRHLWDERAPFHDRAYRRAAVAAWDRRWHALSPAAHRSFLDHFKVSVFDAPPPAVPRRLLPPEALAELTTAGLVAEQANGQVGLAPGAGDFAARVQVAATHDLLGTADRRELANYLVRCFRTFDLGAVLGRVLDRVGIAGAVSRGDRAEPCVTQPHWPDWVATYLGGPTPRAVLAAVEAAGGRLPLAELVARVPGHAPEAVRAALDGLVNHLALFEGLAAPSLDLEVGLLPAVIAERERAGRPGQQRPLPPAEPVGAPTPAEGTLVLNLRAALLELAASPARLKRGGELFAKELPRFEAGLAPLPEWFRELYGLTAEARLGHTLRWARTCRLVEERSEEGQWLTLTDEGRRWLILSGEEQHSFLFDFLREPGSPSAQTTDDGWFLASGVTAVREPGGRSAVVYYRSPLSPAQRQPLRDATYAAFAALPVGRFVARDDFVARAAEGPLLGEAQEVTVRVDGRLLPPFANALREAADYLLRRLLDNRLVPFGCVQLARDDKGNLLISRLLRLDAYFGKSAGRPAAPEPATRVVVQPDFSVVIIGRDGAAAAELAPFCERAGGAAGSGSLTYRLTKSALVRALAAGLPAEEVLARLERHASGPLPANVAREVRDWCGWVRPVKTEAAVVLRCPDADSAQRARAALGPRAEVVGETIVLWPGGRLSAGEQRQLLGQGILIEGPVGERKKRK